MKEADMDPMSHNLESRLYILGGFVKPTSPNRGRGCSASVLLGPRSDQLARELQSGSAPLPSAGFKLAWEQAIEEGQARQRSSLVPSE